jgi:hypothetical protein
MSNVIREEQGLTNAPTQVLTAVFDGERNVLTHTYPGAPSRVITRTYDALHRPLQIRADGAPVATYS